MYIETFQTILPTRWISFAWFPFCRCCCCCFLQIRGPHPWFYPHQRIKHRRTPIWIRVICARWCKLWIMNCVLARCTPKMHPSCARCCRSTTPRFVREKRTPSPSAMMPCRFVFWCRNFTMQTKITRTFTRYVPSSTSLSRNSALLRFGFGFFGLIPKSCAPCWTSRTPSFASKGGSRNACFFFTYMLVHLHVCNNDI